MAEIGKTQQLAVLRSLEIGFRLDGGELGEILLPVSQAPEGISPGDSIEVFIYCDTKGRPIASAKLPSVECNQFALLHVAAISDVGAFMHWGLPKDLLVPFREQKTRMAPTKSYIVYVYIDEKTNRIVGSSRLDRFLDKTPPAYEVGQQVDIIVHKRTDMGHTAIINHAHTGLIYENEVFRPLRYGQKTSAYINKIREDGKIDLTLYQPGHQKVDDFSERVLEMLTMQGGFLPLTDKSSPNEIYRIFGVSKKVFKKAIGALYKKRLISIEKNGIALNE